MEEPLESHVLILPFPAQGHIKPMLCLAKLLATSGLRVTFLNTHNNHRRVLPHNPCSPPSPLLRFESISDGLPDDHPRSLERIEELVLSIKMAMKAHLREFLLRECVQLPVTCVIADGIMSIGIDVAEELSVPAISFRTYSACCLWTYFCIPTFIHEGKLPFPDDDLDKEFHGLRGAEGLLRRRDLPSLCRSQIDSNLFRYFIDETIAMTQACALILNTFDALEAPMLSHLATIFSDVYSIGPLHALAIQSKGGHSSGRSESVSSLWIEDRSCMAWLDSQASRSVIYVSFGSLVKITVDQCMEFWHGLVNCGRPFLWVLREDAILGEKEDNVKLLLLELKVTSETQCLVDWAPQEEVLAHPAVGGFLTHSGWNSTLESIAAGIPMICWPRIADQQINSWCVSEVWKIGLDMKDTCDRSTIETLVRILTEDKKEEIMKSMARISALGSDSVGPEGSSSKNLERLIENIRKIGRTS
ncbi:7-deoxyloganetic acid glucosyltransferase-like [Syzygium oleosum]|uniref:7-deoxyloganetic acid glucosyltransferase-like n=1 Tax=Syzygium oleosum TaxID=219896 RepID=UPI0011D24992|nr:7-deoxyloganetic acid glucosyltransferase-like [Syzygium oleosum]